MTRRTVAAAGLALLALIAPAQAQDAAPQVLAPVDLAAAAVPSPAAVGARIDTLARSPQMGTAASTLVVDAESGAVLYDDDAGIARLPASTNKITTSVAALRLAGADRTLVTRTTATGTGDVYIVGAGDPLLATTAPRLDGGQRPFPAFTSYRRLAVETAAALRARERTTAAVHVDDSLFTGPNWAPGWKDSYRTDNIVAPVSALLVDHGRIGGPDGPVAADPGLAAADTFARLLRQQGITVTSVGRGQSPNGAAELASVTSAPLYTIVAEMLTWSDNDAAESLFRLAGLYADEGASFAGGSAAVTRTLTELGLDPSGAVFRDGSGLSLDDRIPPVVLTELLRRVVRGDDGLWPIGAGLAVAGVTGTLTDRFVTPATEPAAGWVRGKTGTLNNVSTLAGFVQARSGRVLVYASMANEAPSAFEAAAVIDRIAAKLAACGCSSP